jgi:hypothetical protein
MRVMVRSVWSEGATRVSSSFISLGWGPSDWDYCVYVTIVLWLSYEVMGMKMMLFGVWCTGTRDLNIQTNTHRTVLSAVHITPIDHHSA